MCTMRRATYNDMGGLLAVSVRKGIKEVIYNLIRKLSFMTMVKAVYILDSGVALTVFDIVYHVMKG